MPTISKVDHRVVNRVAKPPHVNGSMLARGIPATELEEVERLCLMFYGPNRCGKTVLACQCEKPAALISFEPNPFTGGAKSVTKIPGVTVFLVVPAKAADAWPDKQRVPVPGGDGAVRLVHELSMDNHFKSVIPDNLTGLEDICLSDLMDLPELPAQLKVAQFKGDTSWGVVPDGMYIDRSAKAKEVIRKMLNLRQHLIMTAKEKDHNPPKDERSGQVRRDKLTRGLDPNASFIAASLGQATAQWLQDSCDFGRLYVVNETKEQKTNVAGTWVASEVETGKKTRRLLLQVQQNYAAGVRVGIDFAARDPKMVPEFIEDQTPGGMWAKLMKVLRG